MKSLIVLLSLYVAVFARPDVYEFEQLRENGKHWVFLVAGSNGYMNYRHQVCLDSILVKMFIRFLHLQALKVLYTLTDPLELICTHKY